MRIVFLFLLLANGLLFLWQSYFVAPPGLASSPADLPTLVLLEKTDTTVDEVAATGAPIGVALDGESNDNGSPGGTAPLAPIRENCFTVGPFTDRGVLDRATQLLADHRIDYRRRIITGLELSGYDVILAPRASREEAMATVAILVAKGITNYYVMPGPALENAISLGLFRERRFAVQHRAALQKKGLWPEVHPRYQERDRHWLDYSETDWTINVTALSRLSPGGDIQRLQRACR